jgi:hypothetical protein
MNQARSLKNGLAVIGIALRKGVAKHLNGSTKKAAQEPTLQSNRMRHFNAERTRIIDLIDAAARCGR